MCDVMLMCAKCINGWPPLPPIVMVIGRLRAPPYYNKGNRPTPNPGMDKIIMIDEQTSS
jgi:hypothetical protein